jgi:hypothetical protein
METTTGKLNTAMRILLLLAFDAMPESNVNDEANPAEVRINVAMKTNLF